MHFIFIQHQRIFLIIFLYERSINTCSRMVGWLEWGEKWRKRHGRKTDEVSWEAEWVVICLPPLAWECVQSVLYRILHSTFIHPLSHPDPCPGILSYHANTAQSSLDGPHSFLLTAQDVIHFDPPFGPVPEIQNVRRYPFLSSFCSRLPSSARNLSHILRGFTVIWAVNVIRMTMHLFQP